MYDTNIKKCIFATKLIIKYNKMKRVLSLLALVSLIFTACEKATEDNNKVSIKLTSTETVSVSSGSSMGFITYELLTPVEGATVEATADVDWIGGFDYKQMGKIMYRIDQNPLEEGRSGKITVTYNKSSFDVVINQSGNPAPTQKTITDFTLYGKYYGIQSGLYNYYLIFSDLGLDDNNMYAVPDAHYYLVDLFLTEAPEDMGHITIPVGTYDYDPTNSGFDGTFTETYSWYQINDAYGVASSENQISYESGKLIVEEGKVTLEVTLYFGDVKETHIVVYEGDYSFIDESNLQ